LALVRWRTRLPARRDSLGGRGRRLERARPRRAPRVAGAGVGGDSGRGRGRRGGGCRCIRLLRGGARRQGDEAGRALGCETRTGPGRARHPATGDRGRAPVRRGHGIQTRLRVVTVLLTVTVTVKKSLAAALLAQR